MTTEYEMCEHGRHIGAVCLPCAEKKMIYDKSVEFGVADYYNSRHIPEEEYVDPYDTFSQPVEKKQESGLDAPYYDFPDNIHSAMDLIEWLNLDFSQGNILKSIIRENNPNARKKTTPIYEAEKQYYYSHRRLRSLQGKEADSD